MLGPCGCSPTSQGLPKAELSLPPQRSGMGVGVLMDTGTCWVVAHTNGQPSLVSGVTPACQPKDRRASRREQEVTAPKFKLSGRKMDEAKQNSLEPGGKWLLKGVNVLWRTFLFFQEKPGGKISPSVSIPKGVVGPGHKCVERESYDGINSLNLVLVSLYNYSTLFGVHSVPGT